MQLKVIQWDFEAWEEYLDWQTQDKKMLKRINQLIKALLKHQKGGLSLHDSSIYKATAPFIKFALLLNFIHLKLLYEIRYLFSCRHHPKCPFSCCNNGCCCICKCEHLL